MYFSFLFRSALLYIVLITTKRINQPKPITIAIRNEKEIKHLLEKRVVLRNLVMKQIQRVDLENRLVALGKRVVEAVDVVVGVKVAVVVVVVVD